MGGDRHKGLWVQGMDFEEFTEKTLITRIRGVPFFRGKSQGQQLNQIPESSLKQVR